VSAFNTVVTYDLYQDYIRRDADPAHYIRFRRWLLRKPPSSSGSLVTIRAWLRTSSGVTATRCC